MKTKKIKIRNPIPTKPSHPIGTKKGEKGYNRIRSKSEMKRITALQKGEEE